MSLFSSLFDKLKGLIFQQSIQKGIKSVVKLIVSYVAAQNLDRYGVKIDEVALTAAIFGMLTTIVDYVKHKFNIDLKIV